MRLFLTSLLILIASNSHAGEIPKNFVDIKEVDPTIVVDLIYATDTNFVGKKIDGYNANTCYLTKEAALALKLAQTRLRIESNKLHREYSLLIRDCYRPVKAVKHFVRWADDANDLTMKSIYYPDLNKPDLIKQNYISPVSGHSRGSSIDLTILDITNPDQPKQLDMGSTFDFFGEKSNTNSPNVNRKQKQSRELLKKIMLPEFKNFSKEWWHYVLTQEPTKENFDFNIDPNLKIQVAPQEFTTQVSEPELLGRLDNNHLSELSIFKILNLAQISAGLKAVDNPKNLRATNADLLKFKSSYAKVTEVISKDLARMINELGIDWEKDITKTYDTSAAKSQEGKGKLFRGNGNVTRIFNEKWLGSDFAQFTLSGIANRIDRMYFTPGSCGEIRFIYRLAYETQFKGEVYSSRLPLTMSVLFTYPNDKQNCVDLALRWRLQAAKGDDPELFARRLLNGALDLKRMKFKQLEINLQAARFPSDLESVTNRKFAGQAVYLMRIFGFENGSFVPLKLEDTPDVAAISKNPALKDDLKTFIKNNFAAIDQGTFTLPVKFLSDLAVSYSTLGSSRLANRPFDLLFTVKELDSIIEKPNQFARTGPALLERLNTFTCMGCHQNSSTAGFHFLGRDRIDFGSNPDHTSHALDGNRLALPFSPHFFSEQPRRAQYIADLINGKSPSAYRPHPSAPRADWSKSIPQFETAGENMPCPVEHRSILSTTSQWKCASGLQCEGIISNSSTSFNMGQCLPAKKEIFGGLSCRSSIIEDSTQTQLSQATSLIAFNIKSFQDKVVSDAQFYSLPEGKLTATEYNCRPTKIGVPLGRITRACKPDEISLSQVNLENTPKEICAVVGGKGFEEMAKGYFSSTKFAEGVGRGILNTCSPKKFCREDYICQEIPEFLTNSKFKVSTETIAALHENNIGFCTPTYFVYQLRLDGHPNP